MIYVLVYLGAIVSANLLIIWFGPVISIFNSFLLIGLDLSLRDRLHDLWKGEGLWWKMLALICGGSAITVLLNYDALPIALASATAFLASGVGDALTYHGLRGRSFMVRANGSNVTGSLIDSLVFPIMAFGFPPLWGIVAGQFAAKIAGGAVWAFLIDRVQIKLR
jgi:hypothetical protein